MAIARLDKRDWQAYFARLSKSLSGHAVEIDVESLAIGAQVAADWVDLLGISYDPRSDIVSVLVAGLDHMVRHPRDVFVDTALTGVTSMEVIDSDDIRHIIRLRNPLSLPAP